MAPPADARALFVFREREEIGAGRPPSSSSFLPPSSSFFYFFDFFDFVVNLPPRGNFFENFQKK
jgi:hypothetical protein